MVSIVTSNFETFGDYFFYQNNIGFSQQSIESYLSKVKELNPKKIHLFKNILEEKTGNKINWQHNWRQS